MAMEEIIEVHLHSIQEEEAQEELHSILEEEAEEERAATFSHGRSGNSTFENLSKLKSGWKDYISRLGEQQELGIMERLFELKLGDELSDLVSVSIDGIHADWSFLVMFLQLTLTRSILDAPEALWGENWLSFSKVSDEIAEAVKDCGYGVKYFGRPRELLSVIDVWQRKTNELFAEEIGAVLENFPNATLQPVFWIYSAHFPVFLSVIRNNLLLIKDVVDPCLSEQIKGITYELGAIRLHFIFFDGYRIRYCKGLELHAFSAHLASVVKKIAHQLFDFWINRNDAEIGRVKAAELTHLNHQIDPMNPEFMTLFLRFQGDIYSDWKFWLKDDIANFCSYLLTPVIYLVESLPQKDLKKALISLVHTYILSTLQDHVDCEVISCLLAEIKAVLGKIACLYRALCKGNLIDHMKICSEFLPKVRFLKIELLIMEQLNKYGSSRKDDLLLTVGNIMDEVGRFVEDMKDTQYGSQYFMLTEELNEVVKKFREPVRNEFQKITNFLVKHSLQQLLCKIVFFKAETFLAELLKKIETVDSSIACEYDHLKTLVKELPGFKRLVTSQLTLSSPDEEVIFIQIEEVARRMNLLSFLILPDKEMFRALFQLSDKVKHIRSMLEKITLPFPLSNFPNTCRLGFIDFLCRNINDLRKCGPVSLTPVKYHLKQVQLQLESSKSFLKKVSDSGIVKGDLIDILNRIRDVAHQVEYVIESVEIDGHTTYSLLLQNLLEEIKGANQEVSEVPEASYAVKFDNQPLVSYDIIKDTTSTISERMVDLVDEEEVIINRLMWGASDRDVVSIVGMPGIGKTTLARKVYNDPNVACHFRRRAWCTVSQVYSKRELLLDILSDTQGITGDIHLMSDDDLQSILRRCLLRNRYLIILDDVWDLAVWNDLEISFPNDRNRSRILITSRQQDVPLKIMPGSDPHLIRFLSDDESWMLLEKKVFEGQCYPKELLHVGKKIAQHCQGLPLAVVAIAGLLQKMEKTQYTWEKISESLSLQLINDPEHHCKDILELSFMYLPEYLKPCFLYLGVFIKDKDIRVSKLILLWIAEGFIQETESKSFEDVALDYMFELINRSLVIPSQTRSNGNVKACRLHDLLRDLCHTKAKDENFLRLVTRYDEPYASIPPLVYGMQFHSQHKLDPVTFQSYRLSIYLRRNHFIDSRPCGPITRSLIFFASADREPRCPYDISSICTNFKLLRVLDLECINLGVNFPVEIGVMIHLRYLAVSGYMQSIPPSISNLWKLETLVVKGLRGTIILPITMWSMARLRHLHVNEHVSFSLQDDGEHVGSSFYLDNLVSFSTPSLSCWDDTIEILKRFPNLLKMKCIFIESWDSSKSFNQFPALEFLTRLESLKILLYGGTINSEDFVLPMSLKELTLSNFRLPWKHLSRIGTLPNLRVLKLLSGAFEGTKWEMNEEEFQRLEFLKLDAMDIVEWDASYDHLPYLNRLVVLNCKDLKEIPQDFAYISTLEMIQVQWCGESVEESAQRIGDETKEIKVIITGN